MKRPEPSKDIKDFTINAKDYQRYQIYKKLATLPIESWTDVSKLIDAEFQTARSSTPEKSHKKFLNGLATVHSKLIRHPKVQYFAQAAHTYLKAQSTKEKFITEFSIKLEKIKEEKTKAMLNKQTREISQAEVFLEDNDRLSQLYQNIDSLSAAPSSSATPASSSAAASASEPKAPRRDEKISKITTRTVYEIGVESGDSDIEEDQDDDEAEPDIYGLVKTKDGWQCTITRMIFTTHPYQ